MLCKIDLFTFRWGGGQIDLGGRYMHPELFLTPIRQERENIHKRVHVVYAMIGNEGDSVSKQDTFD